MIARISRNELCKCGSGKKYKKCCMQDDMKLQKSLSSNKCPICSKITRMNEIDRILTMEKAIDKSKIKVKVPICSYECSLAFDLKELFIENQSLNSEDIPDLDAHSIVTQFSISNSLNNEDIKTAVVTLINNEEDPLKQILIEYLEEAERYHLLED